MPAELPFIAILRGITPDQILDHARELASQQFFAIEVPTNSPDWSTSVGHLAATYRNGPLVGAGTILRRGDVDALAATGAKLMVTPNTDEDVIRYGKARGLKAVIGAMTPSEALAAVHAGADALKIFPASITGPGFARILKAVLPVDVPLYAVGGVKPSNLADYANGGWAGFGLGTELYQPGQSVDETRANAAKFRRAWEELAR
jgi:2-dehydro-3-deoxyphosphogalactonate aldolase